MKILSINQREFEKMKKYELDVSINNTESQLFIFSEKDKWQAYKKLLKKYYVTSGEDFSNQLYTISALIDNKDKLSTEKLVLPEKLFVLDKEVVGYVMPFIENNINASLLLQSNKVVFSEKMQILKQIGILIEDVLKYGETDLHFFLGDVHENNFIYDIDKKIFRAVDLNSSRIGNNNPSPSKYLVNNKKLYQFPHKYPMHENEYNISNKETTILCYVYMILNTISKHILKGMPVSEYYNYLEYLKSCGVSTELIDQFALIYSNCPNKIDVELLDSIPYQKAHLLTFDNYEKRTK